MSDIHTQSFSILTLNSNTQCSINQYFILPRKFFGKNYLQRIHEIWVAPDIKDLLYKYLETFYFSIQLDE